MDNSNLQAIKDILDKNESLDIVIGKNANLDDMGAALAFYLALKNSNKNVAIASPTEPLVELSSLIGINKVKKNLDVSGGDLVVSFPYREGEIEKVSYTLEDGQLNIIVKTGENGINFSQNDIKFKKSGGAPKTLFIIGTPRLSDLENLFDAEALKDTTVVNIDNKAENQGFGDIVFVSRKFSSVSEQILELLTFLGLNVDLDIAQNLLSGISFATDNFGDQKTSLFAFEAAAKLMRIGAVRKSSSVPTEESFGAFSPNWNVKSSQPQNQVGLGQNQPRQPRWNPGSNIPQFKSMNQPPRPQVGKTFSKGVQTPPPSFSPPAPRPNQPVQPSTRNLDEDEEAPADWLTPKIYKGSTSI